MPAQSIPQREARFQVPTATSPQSVSWSDARAPSCPTPERRPAWRAAVLAYRQARREGASDHAAFVAAVAKLREEWPELSVKQASDEVVAAIAYASTHHTAWFWDSVGGSRS